MESEEVDERVEEVEEIQEKMAEGIAEYLDMDVDEVKEGPFSSWAKGYKDFLENPIEHYQVSKEKSKRLIKKYQKRIKKHKKKINRLETLIENEKMDRGE